MGRTKPNRQLHCHKCRSEYDWKAGIHEHHPEVYQNIEVYGRKGDDVLCRCMTCGHEYKSRSQRAYAVAKIMEKFMCA